VLYDLEENDFSDNRSQSLDDRYMS